MSTNGSRPSRFPLGLADLGPRPVAKAAARVARAEPLSAAAPTAPGPSPALAPGAVGRLAVAQRGMLRPQRLLHEAARDAERRQPSQGLGLDSDGVRRRMVSRLKADGIGDDRVLQAMAKVPRHAFVDTALVTQAYEDTSLPIGHGQTISKPSVVARMIELLMQGETARAGGHLGRTLEIGTGCGYQAAVLAELSTQLVSIERIRPLHDQAALRLKGARLDRVRLLFGDGMLGHAARAPYTSIIAAAGGEDLPPAWLAQLAVGGRLVAPLQRGRGQLLMVVDRGSQGLRFTECEAVLFVPLKSGVV